MLLAFSGCSTAAGGMAVIIEESKRLIPDYPRWKLLNRTLRQALSCLQPGRGSGISRLRLPSRRPGGVARILDRLAAGSLGQAVLALAYARGGADGGRSLREGLALYFAFGMESRRLARTLAVVLGGGAALSFPLPGRPQLVFFQERRGPVVDRRGPGGGHRLAAAPGLRRPLCPGRSKRRAAGRDQGTRARPGAL